MPNVLLAALDRQTGVLIALAALAVAAAMVSWGAWILLRRERRGGRRPTGSSGGAPDRPA